MYNNLDIKSFQALDVFEMKGIITTPYIITFFSLLVSCIRSILFFFFSLYNLLTTTSQRQKVRTMSKIRDPGTQQRCWTFISVYLIFFFPQYITRPMRTRFGSLFYFHFLAEMGELVNLYNKCIQKYGCQILLEMIKLQFTDYLLSSTPGNWYFYMHSLSTGNAKESRCTYLTEMANEKFTTLMES